jgi:nicotinamide mononucleotide (NMN) deamidase PncC
LKDELSDKTLCPISMASACGVDAMLIAVTATMAEGALRNCAAANLTIAVTGVCGPQPDEDGNPVGLAFVAVQKRGERAVVERHQFPSQSVGQIRGEIMRQALQLSMSAMHS